MKKNLLFYSFIVAFGIWSCSDDTETTKTDGGKSDGTTKSDSTTQSDGTTGSDSTTQPDSTPAGKFCGYSCSSKDECPTPYVDCVNNTCVMCKTTADCDENVYKGGCDTATGACLMCDADTDCDISGTPLMTGKCDTATGSCIKCSADTDCSSIPGGIYKYCVANKCAMCKEDTECSSSGGMTGCDTATGYCTKCKSDTECCGTTTNCGLTCDTAKGTCTCSTDKQCEDLYKAAPLDKVTWTCASM